MDARARTTIEGIAERAELAREYVVSAFELWKSMEGIKKFADIPVEVLASYCLYWVAVMKFLNRDFKQFISFENADNINHTDCLDNIFYWKNIHQAVKKQLLPYPKQVEVKALNVAAKLFDDLTGPCSRDKELELARNACESAKETLKNMIEEEDRQFKELQDDSHSSDDTINKIIEEVVTAAELQNKYKKKAFLLWKDLTKAKSFRTKDNRAQAAAAVYGVGIEHFLNRDISPYTNAPESHLRRCQLMAHDWFGSKRIIQGECQKYPREVSKCAVDTALKIMCDRVHYMGGDQLSIVSAAFYISFKKHGLYKKIEELPFNMIDNHEQTKKLLEQLNEYIIVN